MPILNFAHSLCCGAAVHVTSTGNKFCDKCLDSTYAHNGWSKNDCAKCQKTEPSDVEPVPNKPQSLTECESTYDCRECSKHPNCIERF